MLPGFDGLVEGVGVGEYCVFNDVDVALVDGVGLVLVVELVFGVLWCDELVWVEEVVVGVEWGVV